MLFVVTGLVVGPEALDILAISLESEVIQVLLELSLVIILFTDAAIIDIRTVRQNLSMPTRLLTVGLIGTIALGIVVAQWLFGELGFWGAAVMAITLAPTDAALGQAVVTNSRVPVPVRLSLSVESGLNDGIAVPLLSIAIAGIAGEMVDGTGIATLFLQEIGIAVVVGVSIGLVGGWLVSKAFDAGWMSREWRQVAVPLLAVLCYFVAQPLHGSGFIAAFVGGLAFGFLVRKRYPGICTLSEATAYLLTMLSFFIFGAVILAPNLGQITLEVVIYAVASLTVVRMIPVAVAMIGSDFVWPTIAFLGWFGPRGIASLVFVGTVVAEVEEGSTEIIMTVVATTVGLSVLLHGLSAWPLSNIYGRWFESMEDEESMAEMMDVDELPLPVRLTSADQPFTMRRL